MADEELVGFVYMASQAFVYTFCSKSVRIRLFFYSTSKRLNIFVKFISQSVRFDNYLLD